MNVTREVILDLLPVYLAGEASIDTRVLVDEYLKQDAAFGREIREKMMENLGSVAPPALPPELELKALTRTRALLTRQRWLLAIAIFLTLLPLSGGFRVSGGRVESTWVLARDYPQLAALFLIAACGLWAGYALSRRRLRTVV
jgi:predicted anti-sigma-YlaC factor YlaD